MFEILKLYHLGGCLLLVIHILVAYLHTIILFAPTINPLTFVCTPWKNSRRAWETIIMVVVGHLEKLHLVLCKVELTKELVQGVVAPQVHSSWEATLDNAGQPLHHCHDLLIQMSWQDLLVQAQSALKNQENKKCIQTSTKTYHHIPMLLIIHLCLWVTLTFLYFHAQYSPQKYLFDVICF